MPPLFYYKVSKEKLQKKVWTYIQTFFLMMKALQNLTSTAIFLLVPGTGVEPVRISLSDGF